MKQAVYITDCAVCCALGDDIATVWQRLLSGESGITPLRRFDCRNYISAVAASVAGLAVDESGSRFYPLLERVLTRLEPLPPHTRLLSATTKGAVDLLEQAVRNDNSVPAAAAPHACADYIARRLGLADNGININAACASSTLALARGAELIAAGNAEVVLVCAADIVSEFVFSGFSSLQALAADSCRPFDGDRDGLTLGEGAAAVVLMSAAAARRYRRRRLGRLRGWGSANDANHITAPARDGSGLVRAVRQALVCAAAQGSEVSAISAHGTGTVYNDAMEMCAFRQLFPGRHIPTASIKGATGHTLAAAGALEVALALCSLDQGLVPPTCGLRRVDDAADGWVAAAPQPFATDGLLLSTNSGFGGVNAALLLQKEE